jgi:phosphohistidine phosphatase
MKIFHYALDRIEDVRRWIGHRRWFRWQTTPPAGHQSFLLKDFRAFAVAPFATGRGPPSGGRISFSAFDLVPRMLIYIFRHGEADWIGEAKKRKGEERHLTTEGRKWVGRVTALASKELGFRPDLLLTSPLARAKETAEIARDTLGSAQEPEVEECLLGEGQVKDVYAVLRKRAPGSVALVTHLPLIDHLFGDLLGGESNIGLHSGSVAAIQCKANPGHGKGSLRWLLPPLRYFDGKNWP